MGEGGGEGAVVEVPVLPGGVLCVVDEVLHVVMRSHVLCILKDSKIRK